MKFKPNPQERFYIELHDLKNNKCKVWTLYETNLLEIKNIIEMVEDITICKPTDTINKYSVCIYTGYESKIRKYIYHTVIKSPSMQDIKDNFERYFIMFMEDNI